MSLHAKLITLRKQNGLTQSDLAERLNVSRQAISRWEVGATVPSTDNLKVLGELYGVPIDYLLNDNVETLSQNSVTLEIGPELQDATPARKKHTSIFLCMLVLVMAIVILICALSIRSHNQNQIIPIEDLNSMVEDDERPDITFSLE